jgi:hypothetical protein
MPSFSDFAGFEGFFIGSVGAEKARRLPTEASRTPPPLHPRTSLWSLNQKPFANDAGRAATGFEADTLKGQKMKKQLLAPVFAGLFFVQFSTYAQFASGVVSYNPGTGFSPNFTNSSAALGAPASGTGITPFAPPFSTSQLVSIGAGGSLTLQFNTPIVNNPSDPFGIDMMIFGNSFFVVTGGSGLSAVTSGAIFTSTVSTRVEVSTDGSTWFTLDPSLAPNVGTLFPTDGTGNPSVPVNPALTSADFNGLNLSGIRSLYNGSAGGAGFDLSWARDGTGNSVDLQSANFLRIDVLSGRTQIDAVSVVPEPNSLILGAIGGALSCLIFCRRKARYAV